MGEVVNLKESILQEAQRLVNGPRAVTHGSFDDNFKKAAAIMTAWTGKEMTAVEVSMVLQALKMAREICNPQYRDNFVDQAGYLVLRAKMRGVDK